MPGLNLNRLTARALIKCCAAMDSQAGNLTGNAQRTPVGSMSLSGPDHHITALVCQWHSRSTCVSRPQAFVSHYDAHRLLISQDETSVHPTT